MYSLEAATGYVHQKSVIKNFEKATGKYLCRRRFGNKVSQAKALQLY